MPHGRQNEIGDRGIRPRRSGIEHALNRPPPGWRDSNNGQAYLFGTIVEQLMFHNAWRHMYRITGTHFLLPDLATFGLPLDNPPPAEYEIDLLKIPGVFDFVTLCLVSCMRMPMMRAEARTDFIHVEKELFRGNDFSVSYTHLRAHETRHDLVC